MKKKHKIAIVGAGGIGQAVALILAELSEESPVIYLGDAYETSAQEAVKWVKEGLTKEATVEAFNMPFEGINDAMQTVFEDCAVVLDCLPGSQAPRIAGFAKQYGMHYANLTEYVQETNDIIELAKDAETGFILQTGLAPGFINVVANGLYQDFVKDTGNEQIEYLGMKVGALSKNASAPHFYGFTWSPIGVATEYIKEAVVVRDYQTIDHPSLAERETIIIDGKTYEADLTSGGAADMPQALQGKVKNLDYKTLRYPGHYTWVDSVIDAIEDVDQKIQQLQDKMLSEIPRLEEDVVVMHANVVGYDQNENLITREKVFHIYPMQVGNHTLRAIQSTTAAPLAESCRMLLEGDLKGVVFQSQINSKNFAKGPFVSAVYG